MSPETVIEIIKQALFVVFMLSLPPLLTALVIGITIGMIQAATSIQEQTLTFIPKLFGIFASLVLLGNWMVGIMIDYTRNLYDSMPGLVG